MIGATRRWLRRNRNRIAIGAGVVGAAYLAGQYVLNKISEARERMQLDQRAKENLRRRFEQNQRDCTFTVLALLPTLTENVVDALPVEQLTHELQQKKAERLAKLGQEGSPSEPNSMSTTTDGADVASLSSMQSSSFVHASQMGESKSQDSFGGPPRKSKAQLWNELKISSITRALTLLYTVSLLTLLTRIQLNLLGRRNYLSSVASIASPAASYSGRISLQNNEDGNDMNTFGNDFDTNRRYLTFSWWLLNRGYQEILTKVRSAVQEVFGPIPPTEPIAPSRLSSLILQVRQKVEGATETERQDKRWLPFLLPPQDEEATVLLESGVITPPSERSASFSPSPPPSQLRRLLDETADLVDSPHFNRIHTLLLNTLFTQLIDVQVFTQAFSETPLTQQGALRNDPSSTVTVVPVTPPEPRTKLANILAILTKQAHVIGQTTTSTTSTAAAGLTPSGDLSMGNAYVDAMSREVNEVEAFAAVIYAGNLHEEGEALGSNIPEESMTRSNDSISEAELREGLGLNPNSNTTSVQSQLEKVWDRARGFGGR
ncbi:putative peroxin 3 [Phaeomoniella chlamydospora]|uniref:Putative peroxin 3 n=1 Tax=Phaeomoniella chlamydospora TaxID=158046 RepID=A0A0G2GMM8_PHACM|nr:putative peroxin 3 [Phaeomoniella chlamydospora]